ncbi:MAG: ParB/RepB/Spo0J family partition protein, partial [Panacagrimonas sp.]
LDELAASIKQQGVVQPIIVRPTADQRYEIVAGERRWRAARRAGLQSIPAVVRKMDARGAMAVGLVENMQRADLNPLEESLALHKLICECGLTHEAAAEAVGRSRAAVSNLLRLTDLSEPVQKLLREDRISLGHAKVLLGQAADRQLHLATLVAERDLSVRALESLIQQSVEKAPPPAPEAEDPLAQELAQRIGLPIRLQRNARGKGKLVISIQNDEDLRKLMRVWS